MKEARKQKIERQRGHAADRAFDPIRSAIDRGDLVITPVSSGEQKCTCPPCTMCRGIGRLVHDTGSHWNDDPSFDETCEECSGSGIEDECDYCRERNDVDSDGIVPY